AEPKIRVNSLAPGATLTELGGKKTPEEYEISKNAHKPNIPLGRIGLIEDMGDPIAFLASDAARYITGATLLVDGGLALRMDK
ncbi:MAG: SDR family oxidoreductase, partial [Treponema sp.]|nr:SDR family oxidoreductase [Treponema sp.]